MSAFIERLHTLLGPETARSICDGLTQPSACTFRVNTLKITPEALLAQLAPLQLSIQPAPILPNAFYVPHTERERLTHAAAHEAGLLYIQSLSSMLAAHVLDPQPGEEILDLTAAPGSKTTQIACMMQNQGRIAAVEQSKPRFFKLKENLARQGVTCCDVYLKDGRTVWRHCPERFDRVLLDAPCSSEARINPNDPNSLRYWSVDKIKAMARKQRALLRSAWRALKPGGVLVYSTCTFSPEENELQIEKLLKTFGDAVQIESLSLPKDIAQPGITQWKNKSLSLDIQNAARILPSTLFSGFFICRICKVK